MTPRASLVLLAVLVATPVFAAPRLSLDPIRWFDSDNRTIAEPRDQEENQVWDIADHTFFFQVGKVLDLGWTARRIGSALGVAQRREADNVNALDEVPNSSWYTNRHFLYPMTSEELTTGLGEASPDDGGPWVVVAGKFEGGTAGFMIKDAAGNRFLLKFDSEGNKEMGSSSEIIATKALHAAGYNVPRNSILYFHPSRLTIGDKTTVPDGAGGKRKMMPRDLEAILDNIELEPDGRLRCVASAFLSGKPVGVFNYDGRRGDDPNDRVDHQHRRELRGLRVIGSWMNDADRRAANTLDMYVSEEDGRRRYVKHFLIDMGSAFGSNNLMPHKPKYGNEYVWDPRTIARSIVSLGLWRRPWEVPVDMPYPSLGYFENETFDAGSWVPTYPNPAFERCTPRDGYWGAKILLSFSDEDIATLVATGQLREPGAAQHLAAQLVERRDMIARYWFDRVNPVDHFRVGVDGLDFLDLAVAGGIEDAASTQYRLQTLTAHGDQVGSGRTVHDSHVDLDGLATDAFHGVQIRTRRGDGDWSRATRVWFYLHGDGRRQLVRVERDS